jgi:hypothetical protein
VRVSMPGLVLVPVSGSESCKKHDKQLTFIVRVSGAFFIFFQSGYNDLHLAYPSPIQDCNSI